MNQGTVNDPLTLAEAVSSNRIKPGHTVYLREGVYPGVYLITTSGTAEAPITWRTYPGERAVIDGGIHVTGAYNIVRDLEITNSNTNRVASIPGSFPPDMRPAGIKFEAEGCQAINNIVHDTGDGIEMWSTNVGGIARGNIVYNCGWRTPDPDNDRDHGHTWYIQNTSEVTKLIRGNLSLGCMAPVGLGVFTVSGGVLNITADYNVITGNDLFAGGSTPMSGIVFDNNRVFGCQIDVGYGTTHNDIAITNNVIASERSGLLRVRSMLAPTVTNNILHYLAGSFWAWQLDDPEGAMTVWNNNTLTYQGIRFPSGDPYPYPCAIDNIGVTWAEWLAAGFDADSTYSLDGPTGALVWLRPNDDDADRAHLTVYNWDEAATVDVDVSAWAENDEIVTVHNPMDFWGETVQRTVAAGKITIPMLATDWTNVPPIGEDEPLHPTTFPTFGVFVLTK